MTLLYFLFNNNNNMDPGSISFCHFTYYWNVHPGSCTKWRSIGLDGGAIIDLFVRVFFFVHNNIYY